MTLGGYTPIERKKVEKNRNTVHGRYSQLAKIMSLLCSKHQFVLFETIQFESSCHFPLTYIILSHGPAICQYIDPHQSLEKTELALDRHVRSEQK